MRPYGNSLPGSSVHGIFWARIPEWVAMPSSGDLSDTEVELWSLQRFLPWQADSLPLVPAGKPSGYIK